MNSQFKKGIVELCVLKVVSKKDMYGFEVIDSISEEIDVNENTIYPILRRLTKQEYFTTYKQSMPIGAPRKYYSLTSLGQTYLKELENSWIDFLSSVKRIMGGYES